MMNDESSALSKFESPFYLKINKKIDKLKKNWKIKKYFILIYFKFLKLFYHFLIIQIVPPVERQSLNLKKVDNRESPYKFNHLPKRHPCTIEFNQLSYFVPEGSIFHDKGFKVINHVLCFCKSKLRPFWNQFPDLSELEN